MQEGAPSSALARELQGINQLSPLQGVPLHLFAILKDVSGTTTKTREAALLTMRRIGRLVLLVAAALQLVSTASAFAAAGGGGGGGFGAAPSSSSGSNKGKPAAGGSSASRGGGPREGPKVNGEEEEGGTLGIIFSKGDEEIREITSEEYLLIMRDWAPILRFALSEGKKSDFAGQAERMGEVLAGMVKWRPKRKGSFVDDANWAFGAPVGAFKGGELDALACLQVSSENGVVIEWIMDSPMSLGMEGGNASEWLVTGIRTLIGKKLDVRVRIADGARGDS
jgi:hypothetical protein